MAKEQAKAEVKKDWMGAVEAYSTAMERIRQNAQPLFAFAAIYAVVALISVAAQGGNKGGDYSSLESLVTFFFLVSIPLYGLSIADQRPMSVNEFLRPRPKLFIALLGLIILNFFIAAGSLLLLIFPIIWTLAWFYMATFILVDKKVGPIDALKHSKALAKGHMGKVWGIVGFGVVLNIGVSILSSFLSGYIKVLFDAIAVTTLLLWIDSASALLYRYMQRHAVTEVATPEER